MTDRDGYAIGVDLGTSNTVAVLRWPDGRTRPLLFDGAPVMPSAVCLDDSGRLQVGRDALRLAGLNPARLELNPKRRIDEPSVLLDGREIPTPDLLAAVLAAVARAAVEAVGFLPPAALTYPASWGAKRREVLAAAASRAGWPPVRFVPEPVAAARYFADVLRRPVPVGGSLAVFDFGGGTLDVAVVRNSGAGFEVLGDGGIEDLGGLDVDAELVAHLGRLLETTSAVGWAKISKPDSLAASRNRRLFWEDVRGAKEMLSRTPVAPVALPGTDDAVHLTREELERVATPLVQRAVQETAAVIRRCGLRPEQLAGLFLVGGSSRLPLVARMLHSQLGIAPTVLEQPELPVAEGALAELVPPIGSAALTPGATGPVSAPPAAPISTPPGSTPPAGSVSPAPTSPLAPTGLLSQPLGAPHAGVFAPSGVLPGQRPGGQPPVWGPPPTVPDPVVTGRPPFYRRTRVLLAAAAALVLVVALGVAAVLWRRNSSGFTEVSFGDGVVLQGDPIPMGGGGGTAPNPSETFTALGKDTAYLAWADTAGLHVIIHPLGGGTDHTATVVPQGTSVSWKALVARSDILLVYAYVYSGDSPNHIYALDPKTGQARWDKAIGSSDSISSVGPMLVWDDPDHDRVVGLDPVSSKEMWSTSDPKTDTGYVSTKLRAVYNHDDNDAASTLNDNAPLAVSGRYVIEVAGDKSARVLDVTSGHTVEGNDIADSTSWVIGSGDNIYVVVDDAGYTVTSYSLKNPGDTGATKRLFTAPDAARPYTVVPCGDGICVLERTNSDAKTGTVRMIDTGGQHWSKLASGADSLTRVGGGVITGGGDAVRVFTAKGDEVSLGAAGAGATGVRVNGGTVLLFKGTVSSYPDTVAVTGVGALSSKVKPLGTLDSVRGASCSWNTRLIVCPQQSQFQVWKFA